jgi:hypothetical protein
MDVTMLSNLYGQSPLQVTGASIAQSSGSAAVRPDTVRSSRFGHWSSGTIPAGGKLPSDAINSGTTPLDTLAVTLHLAEPTGPATFHELRPTTRDSAVDNHLSDPGAEAFRRETSHSCPTSRAAHKA